MQGVGEIAETRTRAVPTAPPQAETIDREVRRKPRNQPDCQASSFSNETNEGDCDFSHASDEHQVTEFDVQNGIRYAEELRVAEAAPSFRRARHEENGCGAAQEQLEKTPLLPSVRSPTSTLRRDASQPLRLSV